MPDLGDLLVLLHGAHGRVATVRAVVRTWHHLRIGHEAMERGAARGGFTAYAPTGRPERETYESRVRVWLAPPDRAREERADPTGVSFSVLRGPWWWRYDDHNGAVSNEGAPESGGGVGEELSRLLDPAPLIGSLDFGAIAAGRRAGRDVIRVRATPRTPDGADSTLFRLGAIGADELRLDVDAERGVLLRVEARLEARPFALHEVEEIAFDEAFPADTFVFTPPPGEAVRSIAEAPPVRRDLTIEQAVALAPFGVWIPARMPPDWECQIGFAPAHERPPMAPHVFLHYRAPDGTHALQLSESPADGPGDEDELPGGPWREAGRHGRRIEIRAPVESWQSAQARLELDGTRIFMHSADLAADDLADVAAGLVRAPSEPPRFGA